MFALCLFIIYTSIEIFWKNEEDGGLGVALKI